MEMYILNNRYVIAMSSAPIAATLVTTERTHRRLSAALLYFFACVHVGDLATRVGFEIGL